MAKLSITIWYIYTKTKDEVLLYCGDPFLILSESIVSRSINRSQESLIKRHVSLLW